MKKLLIPLLLALSLCGLCGCTQHFDAGDVVTLTLDAILHDNYTSETQYMLTNPKEEFEAAHQQLLDNSVDIFIQLYFLDPYTPSPAVKSAIIDLYKQIYSQTKYEVVSTTKNQDDYTVELAVYPLDVFAMSDEEVDALDASWSAREDSGEFDQISEQERLDLLALCVIDWLRTRLDPPGYGDPVTLSIEVTKNEDGIYNFDIEDYYRVFDLLILY